MPMDQTEAVAAGRQDSCSDHYCTASCYSHLRSIGSGQHCFPIACLLRRRSCLSRRPVAAAAAAAGGDGETADDCYNAVVAVDNADSVAQWIGLCDKLFHRVPTERSFYHQIAAGSAIVVAAAEVAAVAGIVAELPAVAAGGSGAGGSILDESVDFRWPRTL